MRVYEFAKKHGLNNKDVLGLLKGAGISIQSHIAVLPPEVEAELEKRLAAVKKSVAAASQGAAATPAAPAATRAPVSRQSQSSARGGGMRGRPQQRPSRDRQREPQSRTPAPAPAPVVRVDEGVYRQAQSVGEFCERTQRPLSEVIVALLRRGVAATKNQTIPEKLVVELAGLYGIRLIEPKQPERQVPTSLPALEGQEPRLPVVVVIGHVDHGKTTLLDYIRKTRVASREKGGITQHVGAYRATTPHGDLVFVDTPGHEAFAMMRTRGARVADIAILVVAADDGVMPQTIEALRVARAAELPIIVAINKIDKVSAAQLESVKRGLAQHDLVPEEWGGSVVCVPISAKNGTGVDALLDVVVLQSQMMELKADIKTPAQGMILESKFERGLGATATVICRHGILRTGDYFIAGPIRGRVTVLVDSSGRRIKEAHPSEPVHVAGFESLASVGDIFQVVDHAAYKAQAGEVHKAAQRTSVPENALALIIKTDSLSSQEAFLSSITKLSGKAFKQLYIVQSGIGPVLESDVELASTARALIMGLHVRVESAAAVLAQKLGVVIKTHDIIYKALEDLAEIAEQGKPIKTVLKKIGEATVLKVFDIKTLGIVAGAQVKTGRLSKDGILTVFRGKRRVAEGKITSLQRDRKAVKEVHAGYECAFMVDGFTAWEVDDRVECSLEVPAES